MVWIIFKTPIVLKICYNHLTEIPMEISHLKKLHALAISLKNNIKSILQ